MRPLAYYFQALVLKRRTALDPHINRVLDENTHFLVAVEREWALAFMHQIAVTAPELSADELAVLTGERLRRARLLRKLTGAELAIKMGLAMGQQYLNKLELGRVPNVSSHQIARLALALDVDPGWLAYGTGLAPAGIDDIEIRYQDRAKEARG